jgi:primosomal protein N' (replication factor Y)
VVAVDEELRRCREAADVVAEALAERIGESSARESLIGPVPCFFARHRGRYRWQVVVRGSEPTSLLRGLRLPPNCWVDVDPVSLL